MDLGSGIVESARIVHFAEWTKVAAAAPWRDATPEELRELGVEQRMIDFVFAEHHDR